jgi:hypothetical protein
MKRGGRWIAGLLVVTGLVLPACRSVAEEEEEPTGAATLEQIQGTDLVRVILTKDAAERVDVRTATVRAAPAGAGASAGTVIPYASIFYTATGETWTYTSPEPLTYVREPVVIDRIAGNRVFLTDGPAPGTEVVTQGAAELYGSETGVEE